MIIYMDLLILLNLSVDFLLLVGTSRLTGFRVSFLRCIIGSALGGLYGGICVMPGFSFLAGTVWRLIALLGIGLITFGIGKHTVRCCALFLVLSLAMGGFSLLTDVTSFGGTLLLAVWLLSICVFALCGKLRNRMLVPVMLEWRGKKRSVIALRDSGNELLDPLTGADIFVVSRVVAEELTGLNQIQLSNPVETVKAALIPGLRLIPCKTAGSSGMLLAIRMDKIVVDGRETRGLAALSPMNIGEGSGYEALTGG